MARRPYPKLTARGRSKQYKKYKKITKGAAKGARMSKKQFLKFNYPEYHKTPRAGGIDAQLRRAGLTEKEIRRLGGG